MRTAAGVAAALLVAAAARGEETFEERLDALERRNREIVERLEASEARNRALEAEVDAARRGALERDVERYLQASEGAAPEEQSFWKKLVRSGNPIRLYGFVRFDAYWNSARADNVIVPFVVLPEDGTVAQRDDDQFGMDVRLTRIGFDFDFGRIGDAAVTAKLETDFANFPSGSAESRATPRIRLAYLNVQRGAWTWRFGQDWDVIAPLFPAVNQETLMWNAGNLGDRRPMAQAIFARKAASGAELTLRAALGFTGAVNNQDLDPVVAGVSNERDGFDAGMPHAQVRAAVSSDSWVPEKRWEAGAWGYVASLETDTQFAGEDEFTPWAAGLDFQVPLAGKVLLRGEAWVGQALGDVRGNVGQTVNTALGEEIEGFGAWVEVVVQVTRTVKAYAGGSLDDPEDADVPAGGRERNWSAYVGGVKDFTKGLRAGADVVYWETATAGAGVGNMIRVNFFVVVDF